jgi:hypothetical protein
MSFRSRIEHFEVQKTLQGGQLAILLLIWGLFFANLGTCGAPFMTLNVVRTMQLKGLHLANIKLFVMMYQQNYAAAWR